MSKKVTNKAKHVIRALHPLGTAGICSCGLISSSGEEFQRHLTGLPYDSPGDWYFTMKANNYSVPVQAPHILSKLIERDKITFQEAYTIAIEDGGIILDGDIYFANMDYLTKLIADTGEE
jgi:hypothetical protein